MNKLSLKIKLTGLYSFFMILLTCTALAILFSLSSREVLFSVQTALKKQVHDSVEDISYKEGRLHVDSDFYDLEESIYLSLYSSASDFLFGKIPYGFDSAPAFEDGMLQTVSQGGVKWYVYDLYLTTDESESVYIRGITSVTKAESNFQITRRFALILLPLLTAVTVIILYRLTRRTLLPVKRITDTVRQIQAGEDLTKRTMLSAGKNHGRDEIYQLAQTFDEMLAQLEDSFNREKQFTSDVSHELRTPVSVILAQCEDLLHDQSLSEGQREKILLLQKKSTEISSMISQLLFLSRAAQNRQKPEKEYLNLSELTQICIEEHRLLSQEKQIEIYTDIVSDIYGWVDETLYIRLLDNLISNAVYYNKPGGTVYIGLSISQGILSGYVKDNGIGISAEDIPHIWERFYRADTARSSEGHSGLGLSMVKWIIEVHGGKISAESALGVGTIFRFSFPVSEIKGEGPVSD